MATVIGRLATWFVAVSEANRERMIKLEGVRPEKIKVMPTAYVPHLGPSDGDIRSELGLAPDAQVIGVAAVMREEKALDVMLDAHAMLVSAMPDVHLVIAGDGPAAPSSRARSRRLGTATSSTCSDRGRRRSDPQQGRRRRSVLGLGGIAAVRVRVPGGEGPRWWRPLSAA